MISYAQNAEDVVLERAFNGRDTGFYIDVGAADPDNHSVTRHFYEKGWRGINIDPLPAWHEMLEKARPEDVNLLLGISDEPGEMVLEVAAEHRGGATFVSEQAAEYRDQGMDVSTITARLATLAEVCAEHAGDREIDFLKVDAEGFESKVIRGADWLRWRPRVVLIEATEPNGPVPNHKAWEPMLLDAGYIFALFDGLNRFYVRSEDVELAGLLAAPANVFDGYITVETKRTAEALDRAQHELEAARNEGELEPPQPGAQAALRSDVPNYAFYGTGMEPQRFGFLVVPLRRVLRRLQLPWFLRQVEILTELRQGIEAPEAQLTELHRLVGELRVMIKAQEARSWDHVAIARRLAALEDAISASQSPPLEASPSQASANSPEDS